MARPIRSIFRLQIATAAQQVDVNSSGVGTVSVDPSANAGAIVLSETDLDSLPDDPDDLEAMAGPAAGPNGPQIFIDGFSGGQMPPKSSIREIRINSNPFASEFDTQYFLRLGTPCGANEPRQPGGNRGIAAGMDGVAEFLLHVVYAV
jgi:hypothetical protein